MSDQAAQGTTSDGSPPSPAAQCSANITPAQLDILDHTEHRAAGGYYCGGGPDMDALVAAGLMEYAGRKSFVPDAYYRITSKGRAVLRSPNARTEPRRETKL